MFCSQCGKELGEEEKFCLGCGRVVDRYAGFWKRLSAFILDFVVFQAAGFVIGSGLGFVLGTFHPQAFESEAAIQATQEQLTPILIIATQTFYWLYAAIMESQKGATLGKLALGIRVTNLTGEKITFLQATARHFGKIVSVLPAGFGFLMIAITERQQGLHDMLAKCLVVNR